MPAYIPMLSEGLDHASTIAAKRFDRNRVTECLQRGLDDLEALIGDPLTVTNPGVGTTALLEAKLEAGGFSSSR